jgi:hypothetical protein
MKIDIEKYDIKSHPYLEKLSSAQRQKVLRGYEIYKTKGDFENELLGCNNLRTEYRLLSNLVHPLPISVERMNNEKGRGEQEPIDISYVLISLSLARKYLALSAVEITNKLKDKLIKNFSKEITSILPFTKDDENN